MKDSLSEFYIKAFNVAKNDCDVSFIPPISRRRLSVSDKAVVCAMNKTFSEDIQNIVFSSRYGEVDRLTKMIKDYTEEREVSQNAFSGSVHNYPVGFFLLNKQIPVTYTALSAGEDSISSGFMSAVISPQNNVLFCCVDKENEACCSFALNMSKNGGEGEKIGITFKNNEVNENSFDDFVKFFSGEKTILKTSLYTLKREV